MRRIFVIGVSAAAMLGLLATIYAQSQPQRASQQQQLRATAPGGGGARDTVLPPWPAARNPLDTISPVTDAMLASPAPGEWLTWRRTYDDLGFSPLKQITKQVASFPQLTPEIPLPVTRSAAIWAFELP